jgi:DNA polymerase III delta prime subunit
MKSDRYVLHYNGAHSHHSLQTVIKDKLRLHLPERFQYGTQGKTECHKGTRVAILNNLVSWVTSPASTDAITEYQAETFNVSKQCYLITGPPGAGKSTVATTVVKKLEARHRQEGDVICLQYFVSRNYPDTTETNKFFPALLQQLAEYPPAARVIHDRLDSIAEAKTAGPLMGDALKELAARYQSSMIVLVVDAFEELKERTGSDRVPSILANLMHSFPMNIKVIITSRPVGDILNVMKDMVEAHLETDDSKGDVHEYVSHCLKSIGQSSEALKGWPTNVQIDNLSRQANGLFHYAATAISWIEAELKEDKSDAWIAGLNLKLADAALQKVTELGLGSLYGLYDQILESVKYGNKQLDPEGSAKELHNAQCIMECLIHAHKVLSVGDIGRLLKIDPIPFFQRLRVVLVIGTNSVDSNSMPQIHKSFRDYITSQDAPHIGRVLPYNAHLMLTLQCLAALSDSSTAEHVFSYAKLYWISHFDSSMKEDDNSKEKMKQLSEIMTNTVVITNIGKVLSGMSYISISGCKGFIRGGWHMLRKVSNDRAVIENMDRLLGAIKVNV